MPLLGWPDVPLPSRCTGTGCDAWLDREELCLLARHCSCFKTVLCWKSPPGKTCRPEGLFKAIWIQNNLINLCWKLQGQMITCKLTYTCSKALFWELTTCLRMKEIKDICKSFQIIQILKQYTIINGVSKLSTRTFRIVSSDWLLFVIPCTKYMSNERNHPNMIWTKVKVFYEASLIIIMGLEGMLNGSKSTLSFPFFFFFSKDKAKVLYERNTEMNLKKSLLLWWSLNGCWTEAKSTLWLHLIHKYFAYLRLGFRLSNTMTETLDSNRLISKFY